MGQFLVSFWVFKKTCSKNVFGPFFDKPHLNGVLNYNPNKISYSANADADQTKFRSFSVTALNPAIERTIERPPTLDRTRDCARAHMGPYVNFL
jgi:hypothetical protein